MGRVMKPGTKVVATPKGVEGNLTVIHGELARSVYEQDTHPVRCVKVGGATVALSEVFWDVKPVRKTFAEQFADLPLGAAFTTALASDGVKRVKISDTKYLVLSGSLKGETFDAKLGRGPYEDIVRVEV